MSVKHSEVIERMRWAGRLKNDSAIARSLGVTPQAMSSCKKRDELPSAMIFKFADIFGLSLDWLLTGQGEMYRPNRATEDASAQGGGQGAAAGTQQRPPAVRPERLGFVLKERDEVEYVKRLLRILQSGDSGSSTAIKSAIDSFLVNSDQLKTVKSD